MIASHKGIAVIVITAKLGNLNDEQEYDLIVRQPQSIALAITATLLIHLQLSVSVSR